MPSVSSEWSFSRDGESRFQRSKCFAIFCTNLKMADSNSQTKKTLRKRQDLTLDKKREILEAWKRTGNASETAKAYGISRRTMYKIRDQEKTISELVALSPSNSNRIRIHAESRRESEGKCKQGTVEKDAECRGIQSENQQIRGSEIEVKRKIPVEGNKDNEVQGESLSILIWNEKEKTAVMPKYI